MNNKGFTLIELLAVIAIVGVIGTIVTISMTTSYKKTKQDECSAFVENVENSACVYAGLSSKEIACPRDTGCEITLDLLNKNGYLPEIDACTGKSIDLTKTVKVVWNQNTGEKTCTYNGVREYEG